MNRQPIPRSVVGLDLSLTNAGVVRIQDGPQGRPIVHHARMGSPACDSALEPRSRRLRTLASQIHAACGGADLVVVESPAYSKNMGSMHDRSGLWWLILARITAAGVPCVEVTSGTLKVYATGVGRGDKDKVLSEVVRRYLNVAPGISTNDEADALVIASMGWQHLTGVPLVALPQTHTRALKAVKWPIPAAEPPF